MDEKVVPYAAFESVQVRHERTVKRLIIALVIATMLIFASNGLWLYAWMQYDYSSSETVVEQNAEDGGDTNFIGNDGDINNGVPEGD